MPEITPGPLDGIRVIDLTTVISGPVCTMILADQGADVIKVEPPGGDIARRTAGDGEFTAMFVSANRGKRSIALDAGTVTPPLGLMESDPVSVDAPTPSTLPRGAEGRRPGTFERRVNARSVDRGALSSLPRAGDRPLW